MCIRDSRNGVRPSGLLKTADTLTIDQRKQAEELLQEKFAGAINAGRPMLLDRGMDWVQLSISPEDAQMLQSRAFSVEEVCRFFGVPPFMVGHTEKTTSWGTGLEQQTLGFQKFTLRRRLKRIEQALEKQLLSVADRLAELYLEERRYEQAIELGHRILAADNCWERAYRHLMIAYDRLGNRGQIARVYQRCVQTLRDELDVAPTDETTHLFAQLTA